MRKVGPIGMVIGLALALASGSFAQTPPPTSTSAESGDLSEIIVTAQRKRERLQDAPLATQGRIGHRHCRQQALGVGMARRA